MVNCGIVVHFPVWERELSVFQSVLDQLWGPWGMKLTTLFDC